MRSRIVGAMIASTILIGGYAIVQGGGAPAGTANIWVDQNGGTCTVSGSAISYSGAGDSNSCSSFDAAWDAMSAGQTARVVNGTYGLQNISGDKSSDTFIIGESQTSTIVQYGGSHSSCNGGQFGGDTLFCVHGNHAVIENMRIDSVADDATTETYIYSDNVTFDHVDLYGTFATISINGSGFTWNYGSRGTPGQLGGPWDCNHSAGEPVWIGNLLPSGGGSTDLNHISFQPLSLTSAGCTGDPPHLESIRLESGGNNMTLENSSFLYLTGADEGSGHILSSSSPTNGLVRNTYFSNCESFAHPCLQATLGSGWVFAYDTFDTLFGWNLTAPSVTFIGNLGPSNPDCGGTHTKNVWGGAGSCGSDTFVGGTSLDIDSTGHIASTSPAVNAAETGTGSDYCVNALGSVDFEGDHRPFSTACDAGADERTS